MEMTKNGLNASHQEEEEAGEGGATVSSGKKILQEEGDKVLDSV